jgi:membrane protease YdiL (CAAX protease family)/pimeloyl-ACP methyl ester carboxylesterase
MTPSSQRRGLLIFLALTFGISWGLGALCILAFGQPGYVIGKSTSNPLFFLFFGFGPSIAAFVTTAISSGRSGVKALSRSLFRWQVPAIWYAAILIGVPALAVVQAVLSAAGGGSVVEYLRPPTPAFGTRWYQIALYVLTGLIGELLGGPLSEEPGWRGYALRSLLTQWNALASGLVLGFVWALWHLPLFFLPGVGQFHESFFWFAANVVALSILMTWIFVRTDGSVFLAILMHLLFNLTENSHHLIAATMVDATAAGLVIVAGGLRHRRPERSLGSPTGVTAVLATVLITLGLLCHSTSQAAEQACGPFGDPPAKIFGSVKPECLGQTKLIGPWNDRDGTLRYACGFEPPTAARSRPLPLIVFLHPSLYTTDMAANLAKLATSANLSDDSSRLGFILIAPEGRNISHFYPAPDDKGLGWDNWYRQFAAHPVTPDGYIYPENADAEAIDHFVNAQVASGKVDIDRIYVIGWSNGAAMAYLYGLNRPNVAAIAVYSAPDPFHAFNDPCAQTPVIMEPSNTREIRISNVHLAAYQIHPDCDLAGLCPNVELLQRQLGAIGISFQDTMVDWKLAPANGCLNQCGTDSNGDWTNNLSMNLGYWLHTHWPFEWDPQMLDFLRTHPRRVK